MLNFNYYNPTRIRFGKDTIAEIDSLVPSDAKVMILFGGSSARKTGTLDEVKQSLGNRFVVEFDGIEPNPTYETLMKAVAQVREQNIDFSSRLAVVRLSMALNLLPLQRYSKVNLGIFSRAGAQK